MKQETSTGKLIFKSSDILRLINHALGCSKFSPTFMEGNNEDFTPKTEVELKNILKPALHFIKDDGAYLMSNGCPGFKKWQVDAKFKKSIKAKCEIYKKKLLADKDYWRDRVPDYLIALSPEMNDAVLFADTFEGERIIPALKHQFVVYAHGLNPKTNEYYYDDMVRICGGDDFVELIDNESMLHIKKLLEKQPRNFIITMYPTKYTMGISNF